ncbi:MAG: HNH endonuclease [Ignavibacteria bacterium]|nr:HNH endonuclease [Ignavibacteria bacterium]
MKKIKLDNEEINYLKELLFDCRERWTINKIKKLKINEYVLGTKSRDTFCYWIEKKTKRLGGISGIGGGGSFKFGIFKPKKLKRYKKKSQYISNGMYSWRKVFDENSSARAYKEIHNKINILAKAIFNNDRDTIEYELDINKIGRINPEFGWKIVYLLSPKRIYYPFFDKDLLLYASKQVKDNNFNRKTNRMELQKFIHKHRDKSLDVFSFAKLIWESFNKKPTQQLSTALDPEGGKKTITHEKLEKIIVNRNRKNINKVKHGVTKCEGCNINKNRKYNIHGKSIFEAHHILPIKYWEIAKIPKREDYAVLCPDCHRAIHKFMSMKNVETISIIQFKKLARI